MSLIDPENIFTDTEDDNTLVRELAAYAQINRVNMLNRGYLARNQDRGSEGGPMAITGPMGETTTNAGTFAKRALWNDSPWIEAPPGYVPFDPRATIPLPVAPSAETTVLTFVVPLGYDGVIKKYSNNITGAGFTNGSGDIVWRLRANGRAVRNFDAILFESGTVDFPRELVAPIRVYSGQTLIFTVEHVANAALAGNVICSFMGYIYPSLGS